MHVTTPCSSRGPSWRSTLYRAMPLTLNAYNGGTCVLCTGVHAGTVSHSFVDARSYVRASVRSTYIPWYSTSRQKSRALCIHPAPQPEPHCIASFIGSRTASRSSCCGASHASLLRFRASVGAQLSPGQGQSVPSPQLGAIAALTCARHGGFLADMITTFAITTNVRGAAALSCCIV
jgi:hypothetical protein